MRDGGTAAPGWRPTGLRWSAGGPALAWHRLREPDREDSVRPLRLGTRIAFEVGADRRCVGVARAGRRILCATRAELGADARGGRCPACDRMDRSSSIAADTRLDDPRPFRLYLALHGRDRVKVGITAAERGSRRLLEQGALASVFLLEGALVAIRRAEHRLHIALGLPEHVGTTAKRVARVSPDTAAHRAAALAAVAESVTALPAWPFDLTPVTPADYADHCAAYALPVAGLHPTAEIAPLTPGSVVSGELTCAIGPDLYLRTDDALLLLDTRRLQGWPLAAAHPDTPPTARLLPVPPRPPDAPQALF